MQIDHHSNIQEGCPHVVKDDCPHVDTRWLSQDGQQGRAFGRDQVCKKGNYLRVIRPSGEGSWEEPGLQGRAVREKQAGRGAVRHQSGWQGSG